MINGEQIAGCNDLDHFSVWVNDACKQIKSESHRPGPQAHWEQNNTVGPVGHVDS